MKRKIPLPKQWVGLFMILLVATSVNCFAQNLYVGESKFLGTPDNIPYDGYVIHASWSCSNPYIEFTEADEVGAIVKPTHYFEETAIIECTYSYMYWGFDGWEHTSHGTTYFHINCIPNYATISNTNIELNIGESKRLSYKLEKYSSIKGEWSSSNEDVATVDNKGNVKATGSGRARIKLDPIVGPLVYCDVEVAKVDPTSVSIPSSLTVYVGETESLSATLTPSYATTSLTWYSKDKSIATISSSGSVTGVDEGTTIVYAKTDNGLTSNDCKISVYYRKPTNISLDITSLTLPVGESKKLKCTIKPSNAKKTLVWSSSQPDVASVSSDGTISALKDGDAIITATTENGLSATCRVKVLPLPVQVTIPSSLMVYVEEQGSLSATLFPSNAVTTLTWYSKDQNIATVSSLGSVTGVNEGTTIVYAKTDNGLTSNDCKISVFYREPTNVSLDITSLTIPAGENKKLNYTIEPSNAKETVVWSSSQPNVASVSFDGTISTLKAGDAIITATTENGLTATCNVKVLPLPVQLSLPKTLTLAFKDSYKLSVKVYPSDSHLSLKWTSSDESVATVSADGVVKGVKPGSTVVTVTASNGISASCDVEVTNPVYFMNLWMHDGGCIAYPLSQYPIILANKNRTIIKMQKEEIEYSTSDIHKYTLSKTAPEVSEYNDMTPIKELQENKTDIRMESNSIVLSQCVADMPVSLYSINGQLVGTYKTDSNGYLAIPMNNLSKGIYIIKSKSITYKIIKK